MEPVPVPMPPDEPVVVGWLLVLCLILTVILPATTFYHVYSSTISLFLSAHTPRGQISIGLYLLLFPGIALFSIAAGIRLWTVRPGAVGFTRVFLWTFLLAHVGYFGICLLLFHPVSRLALAKMVEGHLAGIIPFFYLWTVYLDHSKRVRETYRKELQPQFKSVPRAPYISGE